MTNRSVAYQPFYKYGFWCLFESAVLNFRDVHLMKLIANNPRLHKAAKR